MLSLTGLHKACNDNSLHPLATAKMPAVLRNRVRSRDIVYKVNEFDWVYNKLIINW